MDDATRKMIITVGAGLVRKVLMLQAAGLVSHGIINSNQTEMVVSIGMALVGAGWSFWNDYGRAIVLSQLEVLKAKSLAQAEQARNAGLPLVTVNQIAAQSRTMTPTDVTKTVATLPAEIQANVKAVALVALLVLGALAFPGDARAQLKPLTGNIKNDLGLGGTTRQTGAGALQDILGALDDKLLPDLLYAKKLADAAGSKVTGPCYQAWIDIIQTRKTAVTNADGTPMDLPNPRLITDFEKAVELRNALQPDSEFMLRCSPVASMVKSDIIGFIGKVLAGGAGLATLVPGL
jgi:hypothetical protein